MKLFNSSAVDEGCGGFFPHYRIKKKPNQPHFCDYKKLKKIKNIPIFGRF